MDKFSSFIITSVTAARYRVAEWISPEVASSSGPTTANEYSDVTSLRTLSPVFSEAEHGGYVAILTAELSGGDDTAPRNIALTGHYGSGKSSVLMETQKRLSRNDVQVTNLSLPSLGVGDGRIPRNGEPGIDRTNLIQKEIVKQLLYRRKPADTPASRYNRLDTFDEGAARWRGVAVAFAVMIAALLLGLPALVQNALPEVAWIWLDEKTFSNLSHVIQWSTLVLAFIFALMLSVWTQRLLQQRLRITEFGADAGPATVKLSEPTASYFDEYLDEIVYYFQTSLTTVVVFEDLDRFKDPHIFETLRELNLLLNNAEQTGSAPIQFVYAIRDSIFEQLADASIDVDLPLTEGEESRRLVSTNRTKFFDLVVPMVPFISHRTSSELITKELATIDAARRPSQSVVGIVGARVTDMRLIKNICNEYEIFYRRILTDKGLTELTPDRLFASIVYKNLFLVDYEQIRNGRSRLDTLYRAYRSWAAQQTAAAREAERTARGKLRRVNGVAARSESLGERLQQVLLARSQVALDSSTYQITMGGASYEWDDLRGREFWEIYVQSRGDLSIYNRRAYATEVMAFDKIQMLMGRLLSAEDWSAEDRADARSAIESAVTDQRRIAHASLASALKETGLVFRYRDEDLSLLDVARKLFEGADLVLELLDAALIDENFTLYITQFPGQSISAQAMNFIIKAVQPNVRDIEYNFRDGQSGVDDIESAVASEGPRLLGGQSVYNIRIFDYLLSVSPEKLDGAILRMVSESDLDLEFLNAYTTSGSEVPKLIERLSRVWSGVFAYVLKLEDTSKLSQYLDSALKGANPELTYEVDVEDRDAIRLALPSLTAVTEVQFEDRAKAITSVLAQTGVRIDRLGVAAEPLRSLLISRGLYPVSLENLRSIVRDGDEALSLDVIKASHELDVYPHVLSHIPDYLAALSTIQTVPTVKSNESYAEVLADVSEVGADSLARVASLADPSCLMSDMRALDVEVWPVIAKSHRLALTVENIEKYFEHCGIDESISEWLSDAGAIELSGSDDERHSLAIKLLNADSLGGDEKLSLVISLNLLPASVLSSHIESGGLGLIPDLVERGLMTDNAEAYLRLGEENWEEKRRLILVSDEFPSYMTSLNLSRNDLYLIAESNVSAVVLDNMLNSYSSFEPNLGPKGALALVQWAAAEGRLPSTETIVSLASKSQSNGAASVVKILGSISSTIELEPLKAALISIGSPYSHLTSPGRDRPKIPIIDGASEVIERLTREGIISKSDVDSRRSVFKVSKRHS